MLESLLIGLQQDLKIFIWAPIISAIFRFIFIKLYGPSYHWNMDKKKLVKTFTYGFWWGLDFHAYVLLVSFLVISLPGGFYIFLFCAGRYCKNYTLNIISNGTLCCIYGKADILLSL